MIILGARLAPAIGGVAVRTNEQRNVIVLRAVVDVKNDRHLRIETGDAERQEVWFGIKNQPVSASRHGPIDEKEWFHAPVSVGPRMAQLGPALVSLLHFERYRDAAGGCSPGRVEDMRRDGAHGRDAVYQRTDSELRRSQ